MAKHAKKAALARLNIYVPDPTIRRQVKAAAAKRDLSVSEYCLQAITNQLVRDRERPSQGKSPPPLAAAVETARRFRAEVFGGRVFTVGSAELIQEAREERPAR